MPASCPIEDTAPNGGPEDTLSGFVLCQFTRHGCAFGRQYWPGQYEWARSETAQHEWSCIHRFS